MAEKVMSVCPICGEVVVDAGIVHSGCLAELQRYAGEIKDERDYLIKCVEILEATYVWHSDGNNEATQKKAKRMRELINKAIDVYEKKNVAYGDSFAETYRQFGQVSLVLRLFDKYNRIKTLLIDGAENAVDNESVIDTLLDLANYALMAIVELENA